MSPKRGKRTSTVVPDETIEHGLERVARRWLAVANERIDKIEKLTADGKNPPQWLMVGAGIATSRLLEAARHIAPLDGLPVELPDDDEEARLLVRQAMWSRARQGSSQATGSLARALGMKARVSAVKVVYEPGEPGEDEDDTGGETCDT